MRGPAIRACSVARGKSSPGRTCRETGTKNGPPVKYSVTVLIESPGHRRAVHSVIPSTRIGKPTITIAGRSTSMKRIFVGCTVSMVLMILGARYLLIGQTQALPAPTVDSVGFPSGYKGTYTLFYTFDNY